MAKFIKIGKKIEESELDWNVELNAPYKYMVTLYHKPTKMSILQASDHSILEGKSACINELQWRLKHWESYQKSCVREVEV